MEKLKNILKDTLNYLGDSIEEYNVGAWALFRDVMSAEITSHYIFGGGKKPDENLLEYEYPYIQRANRLTKNQEATKGLNTPHPNFTYYTNEGPKSNIEGKPVLTHPETDTLTQDYKPKIEGEETAVINKWGRLTLGEYDENGTFDGVYNLDNLTGDKYTIDISQYKNGETLLSKTRNLFRRNKISTIISGFHTNNSIPKEELGNRVDIQSYTEEFGLSKGRNLLKVNKDGNVHGYTDPYCRVWTWHKQYDSLDDTIRPFIGDGGPITMDGLDHGDTNWQVFRAKNGNGFSDGGDRLGKYGVLYDDGGKTNGLVNITPQNDGNGKVSVSVKKCMFSIENLAWKGTYHSYEDEDNVLSNEQKGPLGGRIMWFPPYDLSFNESTNSNWTTNEFIGRGEPIFTYANTVRTGTLSFKLLIDHPAILDYWDKRQIKNDIVLSGPSYTDSKEQEMLRFFAGCSVLKAKSGQESVALTVFDNNGNEHDRNESVENEEKSIMFFIFYPNNYSGKDDRNKAGGVNAIEYLANGVGTNTCIVDGSIVEITGKDTKFTKKDGEEEVRVGGYEMRPGIGISVTNVSTNTNEIAVVSGNSQYEFTLVKICGSTVEKTEYPSSGTPTQQSNWHKKRYYYRADKNTLNQVFEGDGALSYIDKTSTCLNSTGYSVMFDGFETQSNGGIRCSFADMFVATLEGGDKNNVYDGLYDKDRVEIIKNILSESKITKVITYGYASSQGNNPNKQENRKRNNDLAQNRAETANWWLKNIIKQKDVEYRLGNYYISDKPTNNPNDSNDKIAKLYRFAFVEICYKEEGTENASETNVGSEETVVAGNKSTASDIIGNVKQQDEVQPQTLSNGITTRYDNEARFFDRLGTEEPFMAKLLSERIKNFDPVFHSMSPEGFNARLTFLNQCMRQGPTISGTDTGGLNSNNLAFGRPPVCVLRVGDFYNTKVIITNMTINYDPLVWDLNQEGIGVMPMIANVSLTFNFIGGSDLGGPIQRLQNATSFNYYANTNVYDNRAESIEYEDGTPDKVASFRAYDPFIKPNN